MRDARRPVVTPAFPTGSTIRATEVSGFRSSSRVIVVGLRGQSLLDPAWRRSCGVAKPEPPQSRGLPPGRTRPAMSGSDPVFEGI